jgi:hypothetical protein
MSERPPMLSEDMRAEMTAQARAHERANRPTYLIVLGALCVLVSVVIAVWKLADRARAGAELERERDLAQRLATKVVELESAQKFEELLGGAERLKPDARMLQKISQAARDLGLTVGEESEREDTRSRPRGMMRREFVFTLNNQPTAPVLGWLRKVTTELPGVQVRRLDVRPSEGTPEGKPAWKVDVTFTRWEKVP